jgi:GNAT superfamily N-acetyltransferase
MPVRIEYRPAALAFEAFHRIDSECFPPEPLDAPSFTAALAQDFWAAWDADTLVGFAHVARRPGVSLLARLGIAGAQRCRGIASMLMRTVLEHCRQIGLPDMILYVRSDNPDAIRLYERFGFRLVESAWQFVLTDPQERPRREIAGAILRESIAESPAQVVAVPICDLPQESWPRFPQEWGKIAQMHRPPETYVLIFCKGDSTIGYARLNSNFPGCFPFVLANPSENLMPALASLRNCLLPEKQFLRLTVADGQIAAACRQAGLELNYELIKMMRCGAGADQSQK